MTIGLCVAGAVAVSPSKAILHPFSQSFPWGAASSSLQSTGLRCHNKLSLRSSTSDDTSSGSSVYIKVGRDGVTTVERDGVTTFEGTPPDEKINDGENAQENETVDGVSGENQSQPFEILDKMDLKLDSDDTYSVLLLGGGALVTLYLATSIVGAIDSVPLVPKLLEVVGLSYTVWFVTRYLLFKKNREELATKIEELKEQVLG